MKREPLQQTPASFRKPLSITLKTIYPNKLENKKEMGNFLDTSWPTKINQDEINNLVRSVIVSETEAVIKISQHKKSPGPGGFTGEFYQTVKEEQGQCSSDYCIK